MNITNKIRDLARLDSRRFAKGVICKIITDQKALAFIKKYQLGPLGIKPIAGEPPWLDPKFGKFYVMPLSSISEFQEELDMVSLNPPKNLDQYSEADLKKVLSRDQPLVDLLRQKMYVCTMSKAQLIDGSLPDPAVYNVVVETSDLNETLTCVFIEAAHKINGRRTLND